MTQSERDFTAGIVASLNSKVVPLPDKPGSRYPSSQIAVQTPFGKFYVHLEFTEEGMPCGGWISDPLKDKATTITELVEALGTALDQALKMHAQEMAFIEVEDELRRESTTADKG